MVPISRDMYGGFGYDDSGELAGVDPGDIGARLPPSPPEYTMLKTEHCQVLVAALLTKLAPTYCYRLPTACLPVHGWHVHALQEEYEQRWHVPPDSAPGRDEQQGAVARRGDRGMQGALQVRSRLVDTSRESDE